MRFVAPAWPRPRLMTFFSRLKDAATDAQGGQKSCRGREEKEEVAAVAVGRTLRP
jgi:hypothetical protein